MRPIFWLAPILLVVVPSEQFITDLSLIGTDLFKRIPDLPELGDGEKREFYYYEQTIVVRDYSDAERNRMIRCEIVEVNTEEQVAEAFWKLASWELPGHNVTMKEMMFFMNDCDVLDDDNNINVFNEKNEEETAKASDAEEEDSTNIVSSRNFFHGIFPGTKWCGFGDIAERYHDLGKFRNTDRCCRAHDLCPIKVLSRKERYCLKNLAIYTKSHCMCDEAFYICLKKNNGLPDKAVGGVFFNKFTAPNCIEGLPEFPEEPMKFVPAKRKWL
ncbi:uncharacterized protein LOC106641304 [Copidosoma floridanum]|uniref:uncharacterized protein LOC106641304 n=1 Tax=Copidosoma floridanum TaxID=29053 RepID=UPI0006C97BCC|nr:uncharacterized protein LOC106641304 [Copidosoma floridanum]